MQTGLKQGYKRPERVNVPNGDAALKFFADDIPSLPGRPACEEADPALFDSLELNDHITVAVEYCFGCPVRRACLDRQRLIASMSMHNGAPEGTWGGRLFNTRGHQVRVGAKAYKLYRKTA